MPSSLMPAPPRLTHHRSIRRVRNPPRLPPELYRLIISHITSKRTLHALLFVSKDWFYEAEPVLYHTIRMVQRGFTTRVKLFHRLIECPRVALYVKSFTVVHDIRKDEVRRGSEEDLIPAEQYWLPMNYALRLMDNLQHLHLMLYSYKIEERPFSPLLGCSFQLKSCTLIGADDRERRPLETQKSLQELELRDGADLIHHRPPLGRLALPKDALPNLEVVTFGGSQGLHRIRPALRVKRMLLKEPLVRTDKIYDKTRSLFFDMEQGGMDSLRCFPGLRFLRMNVVNEPLDYFPALLALYCPQLEKLHIHGTIVPTPIAASAHGPLKIPKISISSLIERLFDAIPSLSTIVMHVNDMVECTEWVRDRFEPRPREWECVAQCGEWREEKWGWGVSERAERAERAERELQEQQERERATEQELEEFVVNGPNGSSEEIVGALGLSLGVMVRSDTELVTGSLSNLAGVGAGGRRPGWTRLGPTANASSATLPPPSSFPSAWAGAESAPDEFGTVRLRPVPGRAGLSRSASARDPNNTSRDPAGLSRSASSRTRNGAGGEQHPPISQGLARLAGVLARVASTSRIGSGRESERGSRYEPGESSHRPRAGSRDRDGGISSSGEDAIGVLRVRGGLSRQPSSASFRGDKDRSSKAVEHDGVGVSSRAPSRSGSRADLRAAARAGASADKSHPPVSGTGARLERNRSTTSRRAGERTAQRDDRDRDRGDRGAGGAGSRAGGAGAFGSFGRKASAMF